MKTIILGPTPPPYGGVAIFVRGLFDLLRGRKVNLWTFSDQQTEAENVRYLKPFQLSALPAMVREAWKARFIDHSYFVLEYPHKIFAPLWILTRVLLRTQWVKVVLDGSLPSRYSAFSHLERLLFTLAIRFVSSFVVVNDELRDWLRRDIGVTQQISVIPCLLPMTAADDYRVPESIEKELARHYRLVCSIGVFVPAYGFKEAAAAIEQIRNESHEDIGLILIDGAYVSDERYRSEVLSDRDWISVIARAPRPLVMQVLRRSDLYVRPFGLESYGISRVEAIWCGVPVVATPAGETRGMFVYDFGDQNDLVQKIRDALNDPNETEILQWSLVFQKEAEQNLQKMLVAMAVEKN